MRRTLLIVLVAACGNRAAHAPDAAPVTRAPASVRATVPTDAAPVAVTPPAPLDAAAVVPVDAARPDPQGEALRREQAAAIRALGSLDTGNTAAQDVVRDADLDRAVEAAANDEPAAGEPAPHGPGTPMRGTSRGPGDLAH